MMKLLRIILPLLLLTAMHLQVLAGEGRLFTSEHLTSTIINNITQDQQGYIWIATGNGLNRFDGYRFTSYLYIPGNPRSLSHNNVQTLFVDSDGQLWVGTVRGLNRYNTALTISTILTCDLILMTNRASATSLRVLMALSS